MQGLHPLAKALIKIAKAKQLATICESCHKEFGLLRAKHFCKRCSRVICKTCGDNKKLTVTFDPVKPHRVCSHCEQEDLFQKNFIKSYDICWSDESKIGAEWRIKCEISSESEHKLRADAYELLEQAKNSNEGFKDFVTIEKDVLRGRSDRNVFNYSLHEFLCYSQKNIDEKDLRIQVATVLKAFCISHPFIGYCQGMSYIMVFLLSLMSPESAYYVFSHVVTKVLPKNFYGKTNQGDALIGFQQEKFVMLRLAQDHYKYDETTMEKVERFLDLYSPSFLIPLFVDNVNFQVLIEIWKELINSQSI